jgi:hypothetical protein
MLLIVIFVLCVFWSDRVHVATWGIVDTFQEKVQMTLAIPGSTLRDTLGLSRLAHDYYLKVGHPLVEVLLNFNFVFMSGITS